MEIFLFAAFGACVFLAFICLMMMAEDGAFFVGFMMFGLWAGLLLWGAITTVNSDRNKTHRAIVADLKLEGYNVPSKDILANPDNLVSYGTEISLKSGGCDFIVDLKQYDGVWKPSVQVDPSSGRSGWQVLSPSDLAKLAEVCP